MKKGISVQILILALIFLVIIIVVFSTLFTRSSSQAFDKFNSSIINKDSKAHISEPKSYFGRQLYLPSDKSSALKIINKAVYDCYLTCFKKKEATMCNYIDASNLKEKGYYKTYPGNFSVLPSSFFEKVITSKNVDDSIKNEKIFSKKNYFYLGKTARIVRAIETMGYIDRDPHELTLETAELCCNKEGKVFITKLNNCLKKANE